MVNKKIKESNFGYLGDILVITFHKAVYGPMNLNLKRRRFS